MRHETLLALAAREGVVLPEALVERWPPRLSGADEKGWFRFQRLYDVARSVLRTPDDVRRLVREAAEDDVRDGGRWLEPCRRVEGVPARRSRRGRVVDDVTAAHDGALLTETE